MSYFHGNLLVTRVVTFLIPLCAVADWRFNLKAGRNGEKEESSSGKWIWRRYWKPSFPCFLPLSIFTSTSTFISVSISSQFLPCLVPIRWETQNNSKNNQSVTETTQPQSQAHSFCCCLLAFFYSMCIQSIYWEYHPPSTYYIQGMKMGSSTKYNWGISQEHSMSCFNKYNPKFIN